MPVIEKEFRTDDEKRILMGHSLGGTFTAFVLFDAPSLFRTYIIGSPFLSYGNGVVFKLEKQYAERHKKLGAKVYLSVGDREEGLTDTTLSDTIRFGTILESRKYKGLIPNRQFFQISNTAK